MILVLLGTIVVEFKRPLIEIEKLCQDGTISEEVIVQSGYTKLNSQYLIIKPFILPDELTELHEKARIIITHAGAGSLINALNFKKKIIAIARLKKFGEHVDDHQVEILEEFTKLNYILPWHHNVTLKSVLEKIDDFTPRNFISNKQSIINYLKDYIDSI
jgi:UDP-N-acetylglucosamine transferase subunit ALG13